MNKIFIYNHVIESKCDFNNNQLRNLKKQTLITLHSFSSKK